MLFDSHTHLNLAAFDNDRDEIIEKCLREDIFMINVGTCFVTSQKAITIAEQYINCWASVGLHPAHTFPAPLNQLDSQEISELIEERFDFRFENLISQNKKVVAVGECGLDYSYLKDLSPNDQEKAKQLEQQEFIKQIKIAQKYNLPLILHVRNLYQEVLKILTDNNYRGKALFHFFTGTLEDLKLILQNPNFFIGFSGVITYGNKLDEVIKSVPIERLLIETDAPYVAPLPYRGTRNEPKCVLEVAKKIATVKNLPLETIIKATLVNIQHLFPSISLLT